MITLATLSTIWFIISIYRIHKKSGSWEDFDPHNSTVFDYLGFLIGTSTLIVALISMCIKYLP